MIAIFVDNKGFKRAEVLPRLLDHYFFYEASNNFSPITDPSELVSDGFTWKVEFRPYQRVVEAGGDEIWEYRQV